jgi:hypothetical protein
MRKGDILKYKRFYGLFYHYAMYIGDGKVIHLDKQNIFVPKGLVCITSIKDMPFTFEVLPADMNRVPTEQAIYKAFGLLESGTVGYNALTSNCEHFVNFVRYNKTSSEQIQHIKKCICTTLFALFILKTQTI